MPTDTVFCDNPLCSFEATVSVKVSEETAGDSRRNYCASCYEAYVVGVQHGRKCQEAGTPFDEDVIDEEPVGDDDEEE